MKILLSGATGYLGSHLLEAFLRGGHEVTILKRSFSSVGRIKSLLTQCVSFDIDKHELSEIFSSQCFDVIVHSATNYGRRDQDPLGTVEANLVLPLRLLELGKRAGVQAFVNTDTILDKRLSTYSLSKCQFREWLNTYSSNYVCCNVALEHFYGPGDDETKFVSNIVRKLLTNEASIKLSPGYQTRDFVYIADVVDAFMRILVSVKELGVGLHEFEIGSGNPLSIRHFVELVRELTGNSTTELAFGALPYRPNEVMTCNTKLDQIRALGWEPKHALIEGLKLTIKFEMERV